MKPFFGFFVFGIIAVCVVSNAVLNNEEDTSNWREVRDVSRNGTCGNNVTWTLFTNNTLIISGFGPMKNYSSSAPWNANKTSIYYVVIEDGVTSIGDNSFYGYTKLKIVSIPNTVTYIGDWAFDGCESLNNVNVPGSVKTLGLRAFYECRALSNLTLNEGLTTISKSVFSSCISLTKISIPVSVTTIGEQFGVSCSKLLSIEVAEGSKYFTAVDGVLFNYDMTTIIRYPPAKTNTSFVIPDSVTTIKEHSFYDCVNLINVTIPDSVMFIGDSAFCGCDKIKYLNIPKKVEVIEYCAFCYLSITSATIPSSATAIDRDIFFKCLNLASIDVEKENKNYASIDGVLFDANITTIIKYPPSKVGTNYTIPDTVKNVTFQSFRECKYLMHVVIPDSVTVIDSWAFDECKNLTSVIIGDSVTTMGQTIFSNCISLKSVVIPDSLVSFRGGIFENCYNLTTVFYQGSVVYSYNLFSNCKSLSLVCVSPDYNSTSFGGRNVNSTDPLCQSFQRMFNKCYKGTYVDGNLIQVKKKTAADWENRDDSCMKYQCENDTGLVRWSTCISTENTTRMCVDDECVGNMTLMDNKVSVEIEMNASSVNATEMNKTDILKIIQVKCGINPDRVDVGWEVDEQGYIIRVIIYVEDKSTADIVAGAVETMNQGGNCGYGIFCRKSRVRIIEPSLWMIEGTTNKHNFASIILVFLISLLGLTFHHL